MSNMALNLWTDVGLASFFYVCYFNLRQPVKFSEFRPPKILAYAAGAQYG